VRVVVGADGVVERATALRDPGHGFGAAAEACARRERFIPARDASGQPVRTTAPVRVGFER
jgi:protein TonB